MQPMQKKDQYLPFPLKLVGFQLSMQHIEIHA